MIYIYSFIFILNFSYAFAQDSCDNPQGEISGPLFQQYSFGNWASVCNPETEGVAEENGLELDDSD